MSIKFKKEFIKKKTFSVILFIFSFLHFSSVLAIGGIDSIIVTMHPQNPRPGEEVRINLKSYSFDMDSAKTTILVNNKIVEDRIGLKKTKFKVGNAGKITKVLISSQKLNGEIITKSIEIIPASVKLVYELNNPLKPNNYQGKSTPVSNSSLTIYAIPNFVNEQGTKISKDSLIYTWHKNNNIDLEQSGIGRDKYFLKNLDAHPKETIISLDVSSLSKKIKSRERIFFSPPQTSIEFYLKDPGLPFLFRNIAGPSIESKYLSSRILAIPYFINLDDRIQYAWSVNKKVTKKNNNPKENSILLLNSLDKFTKKVLLSFEVLNKDNFLQSARDNVYINFNKDKINSNSGEEVYFRKSSVEKDLENGLFGL